MSSITRAAKNIDRQASDWLVRRAEGQLPAAEESAFRQWLAADPRHEQAYRALEQVWSDVGQLQHLAELAPLDEHRIRRRRWPLAAAAALAFLVVGSGLLVRFESRDLVETRLAEIRDLTLADGSVVTLGGESVLEVDFTAAERRVVLRRGEGFFQVTPDASRPFVAQAGETQVRVLGTKFELRRGPQAVRVSVLEGRVEVFNGAEAPKPRAPVPMSRVLTAGQRVEVADLDAVAASSASIRPPALSSAITPVDTSEAAAWRFGRLVYEDALLGDLVADVNRYYAPGVELGDPQLGALRVTAAFRTDEIRPTIAALVQALPLVAERRPDGRIVLHPRPAGP